MEIEEKKNRDEIEKKKKKTKHRVKSVEMYDQYQYYLR